MIVTGLIKDYNVSIIVSTIEPGKAATVGAFLLEHFYNAHKKSIFKGDFVFNIRCDDMNDGAKIETFLHTFDI